MTLGLRESRLRQRRRRRLAIIKWVCLAAVLITLGIWAYESGSALAEEEVFDLRGEISRLTRTVSELKQERDGLTAEIDAARLREQEWQRRYAKDVPAGEARTLFALLQDRLAAGVSTDRLGFVLRSAENRVPCDGKPVTKRFILPSPGAGTGGNDSVGFADGTIRITGEGRNAVSHGGFDPAKPVTIRFVQLGGRNASEVSGQLPLHHSVVKGGSEYRFTVAPGDSRGFVNVTGDRCDYP